MANRKSAQTIIENMGTLCCGSQNDYGWKKTKESEACLYSTAIVVRHENKRYVISPRNLTGSCETIAFHYNNFEKNKYVMYFSMLEILFSYSELNLAILVSRGCDEYIPEKSKKLPGFRNCGKISFHSGLKYTENLFVPKERMTYKAIVYNTDFNKRREGSAIYNVNVQFNGIVEFNRMFFPAIQMYNFSVRSNKKDFTGIVGSPIVDNQNNICGFVTVVDENNDLYVEPVEHIIKMLDDYKRCSKNPDKYNGSSVIPFEYAVENDSCVVTCMKLVDTPNGTRKMFKKGDVIVKIDEEMVNVIDGKAYLRDKVFDNDVSIDMYVRANCTDVTNVVVERKGRILEMTICLPGVNEKNDITCVPYLHPTVPIPYVNISGIIVTQLTKELLYMFEINDIDVGNELIDKYYDEKNVDISGTLVIIDVINKRISNRYKMLPTIKDKDEQELHLPILKSINGKPINNLIDMPNYFDQNTVLNLSSSMDICLGDFNC